MKALPGAENTFFLLQRGHPLAIHKSTTFQYTFLHFCTLQTPVKQLVVC